MWWNWSYFETHVWFKGLCLRTRESKSQKLRYRSQITIDSPLWIRKRKARFRVRKLNWYGVINGNCSYFLKRHELVIATDGINIKWD